MKWQPEILVGRVGAQEFRTLTRARGGKLSRDVAVRAYDYGSVQTGVFFGCD